MTGDALATPTPRPERKMSDDQIKILVSTASDDAEAMKRVPAELAEEIRKQQEDVADKRRRAQRNEGLLRLRVR